MDSVKKESGYDWDDGGPLVRVPLRSSDGSIGLTCLIILDRVQSAFVRDNIPEQALTVTPQIAQVKRLDYVTFFLCETIDDAARFIDLASRRKTFTTGKLS